MKLLRVLQEHEFERLGSAHTVRVDIRLIAATHCNLAKMVGEGKFRADLFYRLNVFPITVPPLRERPSDIGLLVQHFVRLFAERMEKEINVIPEKTMDRLARHSWRGNIRELENFIERSVILTRGPVLEAPLEELAIATDDEEIRVKLKDAERAHIARILHESDGVIGAAAARLGIPRSTLFYKMRRLGIAARRPQKMEPLVMTHTAHG